MTVTGRPWTTAAIAFPLSGLSDGQMPIYEYACKQCGHTFDALQKMSDEPLRDCPDCGEPELRKLSRRRISV